MKATVSATWRECAGLAGAAVAIFLLAVIFVAAGIHLPVLVSIACGALWTGAGIRTGQAVYDWRHRDK